MIAPARMRLRGGRTDENDKEGEVEDDPIEDSQEGEPTRFIPLDALKAELKEKRIKRRKESRAGAGGGGKGRNGSARPPKLQKVAAFQQQQQQQQQQQLPVSPGKVSHQQSENTSPKASRSFVRQSKNTSPGNLKPLKSLPLRAAAYARHTTPEAGVERLPAKLPACASSFDHALDQFPELSSVPINLVSSLVEVKDKFSTRRFSFVCVVKFKSVKDSISKKGWYLRR